jgi:hypothetical protein
VAARAFVRVPVAPSGLGLPSGFPALEAVDLHAAAQLPAGEYSTLNDVSDSSRFVVGQKGSDLLNDGRAWLVDLSGATGTGASLTVTSQDLTLAITGGTNPAIDAVAHAVFHRTGDPSPFVVGRVDTLCSIVQNFWGYVLRWGVWPRAQLLQPKVVAAGGTIMGGFVEASARDAIPAPATVADGLMAIGLSVGYSGLGGQGGEVELCLSAVQATNCTRWDRGSVFWLEPFDEDAELGQPESGFPWDRADGGSPPVDPGPYVEGPGGFALAPGSEAIAGNLDGEWCGMLWRLEQPGQSPPCPRRAFFAWAGVTSTCLTPVCTTDLDAAAGYTAEVPTAQSRGQALSRRQGEQGYLLVGGEDLTSNPNSQRAVIWCGYAQQWHRQFLDELLRFDDASEFNGSTLSYGFADVPGTRRISFVHDMNSFGHMVVTLSMAGAWTQMPNGSAPPVEYPCVVTLASDFNGDFRVNSRDVSLLTAAWGTAAPLCDLDGDGTVGAADLTWVLTQSSGTAPCDLNRFFPCAYTEAFAEAAVSEAGADGLVEPADGFLVGLNALGFATPDEFAAWAATADDAALHAATEVLVQMMQGGGS